MQAYFGQYYRATKDTQYLTDAIHWELDRDDADPPAAHPEPLIRRTEVSQVR